MEGEECQYKLSNRTFPGLRLIRIINLCIFVCLSQDFSPTKDGVDVVTPRKLSRAETETWVSDCNYSGTIR